MLAASPGSSLKKSQLCFSIPGDLPRVIQMKSQPLRPSLPPLIGLLIGGISLSVFYLVSMCGISRGAIVGSGVPGWHKRLSPFSVGRWVLAVFCFGFSLSRWTSCLKRKPIFPCEYVWQWALIFFSAFPYEVNP